MTTRTPAVRRGKPYLVDTYSATPVDDLIVWHPPDLKPEASVITVFLEKRWIFSELIVSGIRSQVAVR